ncbi:hypothetical protein PL11_005560 [Lentilactobacillus curieae]|uniref:Uncharacterized protein n=1 Tax=Lentilactobacillus curieae TaxID=1138822 RepID=A0A1S6QIK3_9LACO|nr:hypothetical protein [Lentilactobacillus curieae]AQW21437.1 hypothetical protein PL11_005560 [Lentilactobacillus curieae]
MTEKISNTTLNSKEQFEKFILDYFSKNQVLEGSYETNAYFEYYTVHYNSSKGIIITMTTGLTVAAGTPSLPLKQTENISIEDFRQLLLNKKFAEKGKTLADVFNNFTGITTE